MVIVDFLIKSQVRVKNESGAAWRGVHTAWDFEFICRQFSAGTSTLRLSW